MPKCAVELQIGDYDHWRQSYDRGHTARANAGFSNARVFHNVDNPSEILVVGDAESADKIHAFMADPAQRERMQSGGVQGEPKVHVIQD